MQTAVAGAFLFRGHRLWERVESRLEAIDPRIDLAILCALATLVWTGGHAVPHSPASLTLSLVLLVTALALRRPQPGANAYPVGDRRVPTLVLLAVPAAAAAGNALATHLRWVWPANVAAVLVGGTIGT